MRDGTVSLGFVVQEVHPPSPGAVMVDSFFYTMQRTKTLLSNNHQINYFMLMVECKRMLFCGIEFCS